MKPSNAPIEQRGVVLPLALVMLVMITLIAVVAIRGVTTEERISANLRASAIAFEQAELALRHCEQIAAAGGPALADARIDSTSTAGQAWRTASNWNSSNPKLQSPPASIYNDTARPVSAPQCLLEEVRAAPDPTVGGTMVPNAAYVVTGRGYGDASGGFRTTVQSQLRPPPL
jgi:type IV pilus assembly protein PilX